MMRTLLLAALAAGAAVEARAREFGDIPPSTSQYLRKKREAQALFEAAKARILAQLEAEGKALREEVKAQAGAPLDEIRARGLVELNGKVIRFVQPLYTNSGFREARSKPELDALLAQGEADPGGPSSWAHLMLRGWSAKEEPSVEAARKDAIAERNARWAEIEAAQDFLKDIP